MSDFKAGSAAFLADLAVVVPGALHEGAERIARAAQANAPVLKKQTARRVPGALKQAIQVTDDHHGGQFASHVVVDTSVAFYARFQELGFYTRSGANGQGARFVPGQKFLRRAIASEAPAALELAQNALVGAIQRANE